VVVHVGVTDLDGDRADLLAIGANLLEGLIDEAAEWAFRLRGEPWCRRMRAAAIKEKPTDTASVGLGKLISAATLP
jgi:hypothetical protein